MGKKATPKCGFLHQIVQNRKSKFSRDTILFGQILTNSLILRSWFSRKRWDHAGLIIHDLPESKWARIRQIRLINFNNVTNWQIRKSNILTKKNKVSTSGPNHHPLRNTFEKFKRSFVIQKNEKSKKTPYTIHFKTNKLIKIQIFSNPESY